MLNPPVVHTNDFGNGGGGDEESQQDNYEAEGLHRWRTRDPFASPMMLNPPVVHTNDFGNEGGGDEEGQEDSDKAEGVQRLRTRESAHGGQRHKQQQLKPQHNKFQEQKADASDPHEKLCTCLTELLKNGGEG